MACANDRKKARDQTSRQFKKSAMAAASFVPLPHISVWKVQKRRDWGHEKKHRYSRFNKSPGHHVTKTSSCTSDKADLAVHRERCKSSLGVSTKITSLHIMTRMLVYPFLHHITCQHRCRNSALGYEIL